MNIGAALFGAIILWTIEIVLMLFNVDVGDVIIKPLEGVALVIGFIIRLFWKPIRYLVKPVSNDQWTTWLDQYNDVVTYRRYKNIIFCIDHTAHFWSKIFLVRIAKIP